MLDERKIRVTIGLDNGRSTHVFETLAISAIGSKHSSAIQNNAEVRIANVDKDLRDQLLTEGTPFNALCPKNTVLVEAGRESSGLSQVYFGDITTVNVTQAPDIWLVIRALTGQHAKRKTVALGDQTTSTFSFIAGQAAKAMGVSLDFQAEDKNVVNYSYSGSVGKLADSLSEISIGVDAYIDDDRLVVRPRELEQIGAIPVNIDTGMIGIPEFIDFGSRCTVLLDQQIQLGRDIDLQSAAYPAVNGRYNIYKLGFNIANRDSPFYYVIEAARPLPRGCS